MKGKYHGTVDIGLSVLTYKKERRRIDIDAEDLIYHLKVADLGFVNEPEVCDIRVLTSTVLAYVFMYMMKLACVACSNQFKQYSNCSA